MKYIKKFENLNDTQIFYLIETKMPNFEIALNKIKMSEKWKKHCLTNVYSFIEYYGYDKILLIVSIGKDIYDTLNYSYMPYSEKNMSYYNKLCKYMGEVEITPEDIEKYELEKKSEKYNL
jgi:hypothetical protein